MHLTDEQWSLVAPLIPEPPSPVSGGRPRTDSRAVLEAILWAIRTGSPWSGLPAGAPSRYTCTRRFREWRDSGVLREVLVALAADLEYRAGIRVADDLPEEPAVSRGRTPWWWQTLLLLRSPRAAQLVKHGISGDTGN